MKIGTSNRRPEGIASYFLGAVSELGGAPRKVRVDGGSETVNIKKIMHHIHENNEHSGVVVGPSPLNQRVESEWSRLKGMFYYLGL